MRKTATHLVLCALPFFALQAASPPVVSNVTASQRADTKLVDIYYSVSDADGDAQTIQVQVSGDGGLSYTIPCVTLSGHVGPGVTPGTGKHIVWNAGADWNGQFVATTKVRVTAFDGTTPPPPPGMVYIPAGSFQMGDHTNTDSAALPLRNVFTAGFFMDRMEVSKEMWANITAWAAASNLGYSIGNGSWHSAPNHPVCDVTWFTAVLLCNARSEKEGLTPCYYTDLAKTIVFRSGTPNLENDMVNWSANGYRLPTEAEWEKACRGGAHATVYHWGSTLAGFQANYWPSGDPFEASQSHAYTINSTPVGYFNGGQTPSGPNIQNGFGLYDMHGNVAEWCWDRSGNYMPTSLSDPKGPATGSGGQNRIIRGGSWFSGGNDITCAKRADVSPTQYGRAWGGYTSQGLRCVRNAQ